MPKHVGTGFCSPEYVNFDGYEHEKVGMWNNYHFTSTANHWPVRTSAPENLVFDAFSPNMNKSLHIGHLRNLAIAASMQKIFDKCMFIAWLGGSLGYNQKAMDEFLDWCKLVGYNPKAIVDTTYAKDVVLNANLVDGTDEQAGCKVWKGPKGTVITHRTDGRPTYSYYDLLLMESKFAPDFYITGSEQREHFIELGAKDKHLPIGLVLDPITGKKMKSRDGSAFSAEDAINEIKHNIKENDNWNRDSSDSSKLAWNILAWDFLHVSRKNNVKFDPKEWCKTESPGMHISYTYARMNKAFNNECVISPRPVDLNNEDIKIIGLSEYIHHYYGLAVKNKEPSHIATYAFELSQTISASYHKEKIRGGRTGFRYAMFKALKSLEQCMKYLSMYQLERI